MKASATYRLNRTSLLWVDVQPISSSNPGSRPRRSDDWRPVSAAAPATHVALVSNSASTALLASLHARKPPAPDDAMANVTNTETRRRRMDM